MSQSAIHHIVGGDVAFPERIRFAAEIVHEVDNYLRVKGDGYSATCLEDIAAEIEAKQQVHNVEVRGLAEAIADIGLNHDPQQIAKQLVELGWHKGRDD